MFLAGTIALGLILMFIVLALYSLAVANQYIATSYNLSRRASRVLQSIGNVEPLYNEVMGRYRAMTEAERAEVDSEAYEARFADITEREDYKSIRTTFGYFLESSDLYDIYFAMYDRETGAPVYIADPSEEDVALPGVGVCPSTHGQGGRYHRGKNERIAHPHPQRIRCRCARVLKALQHSVIGCPHCTNQ
jgi:hypothetical protein